MENVLSGIIVLFIILFAVFTFSGDQLAMQLSLAESYQEMQLHLRGQLNTRVALLYVAFTDEGADLLLENVGTEDMLAYDEWDVIVQFMDDAELPEMYLGWIPQATTAPGWELDGLYVDYQAGQLEIFEPGIWNPGEQAVVNLHLPADVGAGQPLRAVVITEAGVGGSGMRVRNIPPNLTTNDPLVLLSLTTAPISSLLLQATDGDHPPDQLTFHVQAQPTQGTLSLGDYFTQADIDAGLLLYTHTGAVGNDTFTFIVTDGEDMIGPFTYTITIN